MARSREDRGCGVRRDFEVEQVAEDFSGIAHADIERVLIRAIKAMALGGREFLGENHVKAALAREEKRRSMVESGRRNE